MAEIADELLKYDLDFTALQEISWKGYGRINKSRYILLYSGAEKQSERGVGSIIKRSLQIRLLVFERRILRKIYGPPQDNDGTWRIKTNKELEILIKKETIVRFIKSQRLRWAAYVIRMDTKRTVKKLTEWDPNL
jgi:hypothetical protein